MRELNFFYNNIIVIPIIAIIITILLKAITFKLLGKSNLISLALGSGGMPSAHSSFVSSLTTAIGLKLGIDSDLFALALIVTVVIIYDAINVRYEAGLHAKAINEYIGKNNLKFNESLGHLPSEAFAGSILGIIVAVALYLI